jgi:hypothetical protein
VALDRPLEPLALRAARDLHELTLLEGLADAHGLTHLELSRLVAELGEMPQRRRAGLLQMAEPCAREPLLANIAEGELHRVVAVAIGRADRRDVARPRLDHGHALDPAVLLEDLRHAELPAEDRRHQLRTSVPRTAAKTEEFKDAAAPGIRLRRRP